MEVPDHFQKHRPCHDAVDMPRQEFKQLELARLQIDFTASAADTTLQKINLKISAPQNRHGGRNGRASREGVHPGHDFGKSKGLDEIVVTTGIKSLDAIVEVTEKQPYDPVKLVPTVVP